MTGYALQLTYEDISIISSLLEDAYHNKVLSVNPSRLGDLRNLFFDLTITGQARSGIKMPHLVMKPDSVSYVEAAWNRRGRLLNASC